MAVNMTHEQFDELISRLESSRTAATCQGSALSKIKLPVPVFKPGDDVETAIQEVGNYCKHKKLTDEEAVTAWEGIFTKTGTRQRMAVKKYLRNNESVTAGDWETVLAGLHEMLRTKFEQIDAVQENLNKILSLKQGPSESIDDYDARFSKFEDRLETRGRPVTNEDKIAYYKRGLQPAMAAKLDEWVLRNDEDDLDEMRKFLRKCEKTHGKGEGDEAREISDLQQSMKNLQSSLNQMTNQMTQLLHQGGGLPSRRPPNSSGRDCHQDQQSRNDGNRRKMNTVAAVAGSDAFDDENEKWGDYAEDDAFDGDGYAYESENEEM